MSDFDRAKRLFFEALDCMDARNFCDAERRLRDALQLAPTNVSILTNLAVVLQQQGKRREAREHAEKAIAVQPDNVEALLVLADARMGEQEFNAALDAYDRIIMLDPNIAQVYNNRGITLEKVGRHGDALDSYERAIALAPDFADAHVNRGRALRRHKRHDEAIAAYDQALALDPGLAHAWLGRGNVLSDLKRDEDALAAYDKALGLKSDLASAWLGRGNVFGRLRRHDEALAAYDQALALEPALAEAWLGQGNTLCELKRCEDALVPYDKALALKPELGEAWLGRGNALRWSKRTPEAIEAYRQALKFGGDAASITYCLAALGAAPRPAAPPERYFADLFDSYADDFEHDLVENLNYHIPAVLADTIRRYTSSRALDILDLGCGTGLVGAQIRPVARTLTGIDVSANMLEKARQRQIYDQLLCGDAAQVLQAQDRQFDLALAADVFIYVGELSPIFRAVRAALRAGGLFGFSVEAAEQGDFVLLSTLRYAHSIGYLRRLAEQHRFAVELIEPQVIRRDAGADVAGYLAVMRVR